MHVDALRRLAPSEVGHDPHIRVGVLQAADEIVPQPLGLLKGMYLVLVGKGKGAVEGGRSKVGIKKAGMFAAGNLQLVLLPLLRGGKSRAPRAGCPHVLELVRYIENLLLTDHS